MVLHFCFESAHILSLFGGASLSLDFRLLDWSATLASKINYPSLSGLRSYSGHGAFSRTKPEKSGWSPKPQLSDRYKKSYSVIFLVTVRAMFSLHFYILGRSEITEIFEC